MKTLNVMWLIALLCICACTKNGEQDDLSRAQACLDQVSESDPAAASQCMSYIQNYNDQQADILKCGILETSGGLTEDKMITAYNTLSTTSGQSSNPAAFISALNLSLPDVNTGYTTAQQADTFCRASGVEGLEYISGLIVAGSFIASELASLGGSIDPNDPSSVSTGLQTLISNCTGNSTTCSPSTLGSTVTNLSGTYCATPSASQSVCSQVNGAISSAGSDPTKVGQAFLCYLNQQTYNSSTGACQ